MFDTIVCDVGNRNLDRNAAERQGSVSDFLQCLEIGHRVTLCMRITLKVLFSENLKQQLDDHVEMLPVVRLIRLQERAGVVRARQQGAALATGDVLVFLDSHCECTPGNYYPLCNATDLRYSCLVQYF